MIKKFQQGGQLQDAIMLFVQGLAQALQADPLQVILVAQLNPEALKTAVLVYQLTQDMGLAAQAFLLSLQAKTKAMKHGAKLQYIKSLKHKCANDEELYYYKKGGSVGCGCKKKEDGGEVTKASKGCSAVEKFKAIRKGSTGYKNDDKQDSARRARSIVTFASTVTGQQAGFNRAEREKDQQNKQQNKQQNNKQQNNKKSEVKEGWDDHGNYIITKKGIKERESQLKSNKTLEETTPPKINKGIHKNACGSKIKKDCGGAVAKFKAARCGSKMKKHKLGGSLNGIPFYLGGTPEGGILFKENLEPPTQGLFGEIGRNLSQGNEIFGKIISSPATQILLTGIGAGVGGMVGPKMKVGKTIKELVTNPRNAIRKLSRNLNAKKGDPSFRWTKTSGNLRNGTAQEYTYSGMGRNTQRGVLKTGRSEGSGYNALTSLNRNPTYLRASAPGLTQSQRFWNNNRAEPVEWQASRRVMQRNNLIDLARDWRNYIFENPSYGRLNFKVK